MIINTRSSVKLDKIVALAKRAGPVEFVYPKGYQFELPFPIDEKTEAELFRIMSEGFSHRWLPEVIIDIKE